MSRIIWHWTNGSSNIFTRRIAIVDKAMNEGYYVMPMMIQSHTFKPDDFSMLRVTWTRSGILLIGTTISSFILLVAIL